MIIFNDTLGAYGGSHTLMLRMCSWLRNKRIRTGIFCDNRNNDEIAKELESLGVEIYVVDIQKPKCVKKLLKEIQDEVKIISFSWNFYLDMERAKRVCGLCFDNLVYCIHAATFQKGSGFKSSWMKKYSVQSYRGIYERMEKNNALIMMDEICDRISKEYLGANIGGDLPILRIPMQCEELSAMSVDRIIENGYRHKIIMTASRAEIPYKGYMLGLIKDFGDLKKKYPELKLQIISDGEDIEQVENKIKQLPEDVQRDVDLQGWMDYEALKKRLEDCMIFIGMGTSILDAALKYKPAIPVKFYTVENLAESVFADEPKNICAGENCDSKAYVLLEKLLALPEKQYREACMASFDAAKENYDIEMIMTKMVNFITNDKGCILTGRECFVHMLNNGLNRIRYKNANQFDCRSISSK